MIHVLKTLPEYFQAVLDGTKPFELRRSDRPFRVGDLLRLQEYDGTNWTGRETTVEVTYILPGGSYGLSGKYCILGVTRGCSRFPIPGDTVYNVLEDLEKIGEPGIEPVRVTGVGFKGFTIPAVADDPDDMGELIQWDEIGEWCFLTREEAEAALARLQANGKA